MWKAQRSAFSTASAFAVRRHKALPGSVLRLRRRAQRMILTLALRSSSLADAVYELSEQALDQAQQILFDALKGETRRRGGRPRKSC